MIGRTRGIALLSVARYDGSDMDEEKRADPQEPEQVQKQEQKLGDLEVPDEQGDAVTGGTDRNTDFKEKFP
jgi:hypothetical protein